MNKIFISILCFTFLLVSNASISYAFVHKDVQYVENWSIRIYRKESGNYMWEYVEYADGNKAEKSADNTFIYKDTKNTFTIEENGTHCKLIFTDAKLNNGLYSHEFEFDMDNPDENKESTIDLFDDENGIKVSVRKRLVEANHLPVLY